MKKVSVSELSGEGLDYAVALAEIKGTCWEGNQNWVEGYIEAHAPSTNWQDAGSIIEREGISLLYRIGKEGVCNPYYHAQVGPEEPENHTLMTDENPLVAAMRSFVASKFGDYVEIQNELL